MAPKWNTLANIFSLRKPYFSRNGKCKGNIQFNFFDFLCVRLVVIWLWQKVYFKVQWWTLQKGVICEKKLFLNWTDSRGMMWCKSSRMRIMSNKVKTVSQKSTIHALMSSSISSMAYILKTCQNYETLAITKSHFEDLILQFIKFFAVLVETTLLHIWDFKSQLPSLLERVDSVATSPRKLILRK